MLDSRFISVRWSEEAADGRRGGGEPKLKCHYSLLHQILCIRSNSESSSDASTLLWLSGGWNALSNDPNRAEKNEGRQRKLNLSKNRSYPEWDNWGYLIIYISMESLLFRKAIEGNLDQYLKDRKAATPALIQMSSMSLDDSSMYMTKLVEWPVVDSVPRLDSTLYRGQL